MSFSKRTFTMFLVVVLAAGSISALFNITSAIAASDPCSSDVANQTKAQLQADLDACNAEIAEWTATLNNTKTQSASYARDVAALTAKINAAKASINSKNIAITKLSRDIASKQATINTLEGKLSQGQQSLAEILRATNEIDSYSLPEAVLSNQSISDFFTDVDAYAQTESALNDVLDQVKGTKSETEAVKADLAKQKDEATAEKNHMEEQKKQVESDQAAKAELLADSKSKEKAYSDVVADKQAKAAAIRAALFPLRDVDSQIQFGTALTYANAASAATGVRPALILGILQQESNLGANVGSCVITDLSTGATKNVSTGKVYPNGIHPTRDLPLLQTIVTGLGRDPLTTKVSCPYGGGYGGAMGPTQFIPSTWKIISGKVESALGENLADPWNPKDAIYAAAYLLAGNGAATQNYTNERTAACRYYSGRNCYNSDGTAGVGLPYGNSVMNKASIIQATIDQLQGT